MASKGNKAARANLAIMLMSASLGSKCEIERFVEEDFVCVKERRCQEAICIDEIFEK